MDTQTPTAGTNPFWLQSQAQESATMQSDQPPQDTSQDTSSSSNPYWNTPSDLASAQAKTGSQDDNGLCQKFVEQAVYGKTGIFPSAVAAWNSYAKSGTARAGSEGMKRGDLVYFSPNQGNHFDGHVGIFQGNGKFISATGRGVQSLDLDQWQHQTNQHILGYVPVS